MIIQNTIIATQTSLAYARTSDDVSRVALDDFATAVPPLSSAEIKNVMEDINAALRQSKQNVQLQYSVDADTKKSVIKVVDTTTGELVRQMPSEEVLAIARSIDQFQKSLLIKEKA